MGWVPDEQMGTAGWMPDEQMGTAGWVLDEKMGTEGRVSENIKSFVGFQKFHAKSGLNLMVVDSS